MRIAIVNDLALAREALRRVVLSVPGYTVAWMAADGTEAVRKAAEDRPDVILMDLLMPVLDGVEATRRIMATNPLPILLVTSCAAGNNIGKVYEAMGYGGLDAVVPPTLGADGKVRDGDSLLARLAKLEKLHRRGSGVWQAPVAATQPTLSPPGTKNKAASVLPALVALGASTGGPDALARILAALPVPFPAAVVVVQHIAADFAPNLAVWLQGHTPLPVRLAREGDEPCPGHVLLAGTNDHLVLRPDQRLVYSPTPRDHPYRPSVDVFFQSLASNWPRPGTAVLLTGMGSDGAAGLSRLRGAGWFTVAQDQASCVVYGMPRAAVALGAASQVLPVAEIAAAIAHRVNTAV